MTGAVPRRGRRLRRLLAVLLVATVAVVAAAVVSALSVPGSDSTAAKLAEWGRGHGFSSVIDALERRTYQAPQVGGALAAGSPLLARPGAARRPGRTSSAAYGAGQAVPFPPSGLASVVPVASPSLPGEGAWQVLAAAHGRPILQVAFLRPDSQHTSYTAGVIWMDTTRVQFVLHPGTQEPGRGPWSQAPQISSAERTRLLGAFNGGFRLDAARGGFYEGGRTAGTLRNGAASLVITTDARAAVAQWGRDAQLGPTIAAVRQNLDLLVDHGTVLPGLDSNINRRWGATIGNRRYVWRSGVGQTAAGALVYVAGDRLSAASLAELLRRAGSVRAMELDINPEWTSYVLYPAEKNLLPNMNRSPRRYDTTSSRDFITVLRDGP